MWGGFVRPLRTPNTTFRAKFRTQAGKETTEAPEEDVALDFGHYRQGPKNRTGMFVRPPIEDTRLQIRIDAQYFD
jgi:hypothetical protein